MPYLEDYYKSRRTASERRVSNEGFMTSVCRVTDNRLRAMRFWIENERDPKRDRQVRFLIGNLADLLEGFAERAGWDPYFANEEVTIRNLLKQIRELSKSDWPKFKLVYNSIGRDVPKTVGKRLSAGEWR